jgi:phosphatidylinositol alpha-1,6-mannosyltransferase
LGGSALATPLVLILARLFRRRAVVLTHGLDVIHRNFFYQLLCVRWLKYCDRVIANSRYTAGLLKSKGAAEERLTVIAPGVAVERFELASDMIATKRRWDVEGKKIILFVGRLARRKGVREFVEHCLAAIVRQVPNAVFLIAGENPTQSLAHHENLAGEIAAAISRLDLEKHARLLGALADEEISELYRASDVVVLPALPLPHDVEGFGMVALEAAAAAKPVVAARVGGIVDAVEDGRSGILVESRDYRRLTQVVVELLTDPNSALSLGRYGRDRVRRRFAWQRIVEDYEAMLAELESPSAIR